MSPSYLYLISSALLVICRCHQLTVSVANLDKLKKQDYIDLLKAGTTQIVFAQNWLNGAGSVVIPNSWINASFAADISKIADKYNATTFVGLSALPFIGNQSRSLYDFKMNVQSFIKSYDFDGVLFELWTKPFPQGKDWKVVSQLGAATKSLKTGKGAAVTASLMFMAANFTTSSALWNDLQTYEPWMYMDDSHAVFDSLDVDFEKQITLDWTQDVVTRLMNYTMKPSRLSLGIIPEALSHTKPSDIYRHLVDLGAPTYGNGHFEDYYYNTQKQIKEKRDLERKYGLRGLSFIFPSCDLPPYNQSSLISAAT
ncbi:hypothetical protein FOL47_009257 [Perkinsus chesapeaki]|uniref:Chitinase n=1 Tax=Perkinsus chesapeaki TaxID=330153 RepID=A0A7J6L9D2_PERCH|nr:hypothetical protein FOL47_009257 [Perkinsus chesapeaki]